MGASLTVYVGKLKEAAADLEACLAELKKKKKSADSLVKQLGSSWKGEEAEAFLTQWNRLWETDSSYAAIQTQLTDYAVALRTIAATYQEVQEEAQALAAKLKTG